MPKRVRRSTMAELFSGKQKEMLAGLRALRRGVYHAPTMGDGGEERWRKLFREYLPSRYQVEKAHVIDSTGSQSDQIDVVIFDRQYANLIFNDNGIIYVPAESVYAVCEIKQNLTKTHLEYAGKKLLSVRRLKRTSIAVPQINGRSAKKRLKKIIGCMIVIESDYKPAFGSTFKRNHQHLRGRKKIDLIYSLSDGLSEIPTKKDKGLVLFMFKLLTALQKMGNAPAVDFNAYIKRL